MQNMVIRLSRESADQLAEPYFLTICHFDRNSERHKSLINQGFALRERISGQIQPQAVVSSLGRDVVQSEAFAVSGTLFPCKALARIDRDSVLDVYAYVLTAGDFVTPEDNLLDMFFADAWGTAYVDAGRDLLKSTIEQEASQHYGGRVFVSDSFGPGYYGMDVSQVKGIFSLVEAGKIGVRLNDAGMMFPMKSCSGFFLVLDDPSQMPGPDCKSCSANAQGCQFCRFRTKAG